MGDDEPPPGGGPKPPDINNVNNLNNIPDQRTGESAWAGISTLEEVLEPEHSSKF